MYFYVTYTQVVEFKEGFMAGCLTVYLVTLSQEHLKK